MSGHTPEFKQEMSDAIQKLMRHQPPVAGARKMYAAQTMAETDEMLTALNDLDSKDLTHRRIVSLAAIGLLIASWKIIPPSIKLAEAEGTR